VDTFIQSDFGNNGHSICGIFLEIRRDRGCNTFEAKKKKKTKRKESRFCMIFCFWPEISKTKITGKSCKEKQCEKNRDKRVKEDRR